MKVLFTDKSVDTSASAPSDCDNDAAGCLRKLFVDVFQARHHAGGEVPARRPVFLRAHGVAHARFEVRPDLPKDLAVGVFAQKPAYPAWVRFSSDVQDGNPDRRGTIGIGIKLFGVEGTKLLEPDDGARTHDFVLQNHDRFFVPNAKEMCTFTSLALRGRGEQYLQAHPLTRLILGEMEKDAPSALATPMWSVLPSRFGASRHVKYSLVPELVPGSALETPDYDDPFYLRVDLAARLRLGEARFRFYVQFQIDEQSMPIDDATVRWSEDASPPIHVATLVLPQQEIVARGQDAYGENLAFNPWHALPEHSPVGSLADARRVVYVASAAVRRNTNGVPLGEPEEPRPTGGGYPAARDTTIVRAAIHPGIGVARVGGGTEFLIGPEVLDPPALAPGAARDATGALKRQAARFRVYGYNAAGEVVAELNADNARITWSAHLVNSKAAWYRWNLALDIPEAKNLRTKRRNATVVGSARTSLVIDGGLQSVEGRNTNGPHFDGAFLETPVCLGQLRTDENGRLLVLPGHGKSASPSGSPVYDAAEPDGFGNGEGWYDDVADGPVTARVTIEEREIPVEGAWVVTAPPDYAPGTKAVRTLWDLLVDVHTAAGRFPMPTTVSFANDVLPILQRLSRLQWVNKGFAAQYGRSAPFDFDSDALIDKLAARPVAGFDTYAQLRREICHAFRDPRVLSGAASGDSPQPWPWIYGDAMMETPPSPREHIALSSVQYAVLDRWAAGAFVDDRGLAKRVPDVDDLPLPDRPGTLDRAALDHCLADAFHPGCEVTWPVRHVSMFGSPFRIRHRASGAEVPNYGDELDAAKALGADGPLHAQGPGDLTRWMAIPWQADTAYCRSGYTPRFDPYLPTFWPARVPNQVLSEADYQTAIDGAQPRAARLAAFSRREVWTRLLGTGSTTDQMLRMVGHFDQMGVVEPRPGVQGDAELPELMWVESVGPHAPRVATVARALAIAGGRPSPAQEAGWSSDEELSEAIRMRRRGRP